MDVADYAAALWALLPPGPAFSEDVPHISAWVNTAAKALADVDNDAIQRLLSEANPYTVLVMLPAMEASLGLPDSCTTASPTIAERRANIVARLTDVGGARISRFVQIAKALGYTGVSTSRYTAHHCESACDVPIYSEDWRFAWVLTVPTSSAVTDSDCNAGCDDPIRTWGDAVLECVMQRENPQPSILQIAYGAT